MLKKSKNWQQIVSKVVVLAFALFAFSSGASAATVSVTPSNMDGWSFVQENATGGGVLVSGPSTPTMGSGSAKLTVDGTGGVLLGKATLNATRLDAITDLEYSTYRASGADALAIALQFNIDTDLTDTNTAWQGRLVYEPYFTETVTTGNWQTWDPQDGEWWFSGAPGNSTCPQSNPCTWSEVLAAYPNAGIHATLGGVGFKAGSGWTGGFEGNVDAFKITVNGVTTIYDFESTVADVTAPLVPTHLSPANNSTLTSAQLTKIDWSDVTDPSSPVTYFFESSNSSGTNGSGAFTAPAYVSPELSVSEVNTSGTPEGTYFWHVRSSDSAGNLSAWSTPWSVTIDNDTDPEDADNDGVLDENDNCPSVANTNQTNTDNDSMGDVCDTDKDNDTILNSNDNCELVSNTNQLDSDNDGLGDACDTNTVLDSDNDGVANSDDNCPTTANSNQADSDHDGIGDVCDSTPNGNGPSNKDACKGGGWKDFTNPSFRNQGQCVSWFNRN